jgi:uncharacterized protein YdaU (DUF1376 family)
MAIPYFPMYAQDWLCDPEVSSLSFEEQGIFFHLMCRMWQTSTCSLPDDDLKIARMLRLNHNKWQRVKQSLSSVITFKDGVFFSSRLSAEFSISGKKSKNNSETAKNREEVKRLKLLNNNNMDSTDVPRTQHHKIREDKISKEDKIPSSSVDEVDGIITKKKRTISGKRLESFYLFWEAFNYKKGKAEAADSWLDIPQLTNALVDRIVKAAKVEAIVRPELIAAGKTPKMAQGWLTARRWEDEQPEIIKTEQTSFQGSEALKRKLAQYE